jgi:hypothetical protein
MKEKRRGGRLVRSGLVKWISVVKFNLYAYAVTTDRIGSIIQQRPKSEAFHL